MLYLSFCIIDYYKNILTENAGRESNNKSSRSCWIVVHSQSYKWGYVEVKLAEELNKNLNKAEIKHQDCLGKVKAIVGPHAGFAYSGPVAAWGYKYL